MIRIKLHKTRQILKVHLGSNDYIYSSHFVFSLFTDNWQPLQLLFKSVIDVRCFQFKSMITDVVFSYYTMLSMIIFLTTSSQYSTTLTFKGKFDRKCQKAPIWKSLCCQLVRSSLLGKVVVCLKERQLQGTTKRELEMFGHEDPVCNLLKTMIETKTAITTNTTFFSRIGWSMERTVKTLSPDQ